MIQLSNWVEASQDFWPNGENNMGVECGSRGWIYEGKEDGALLIAFPEAIVNFTDMQYVRPLQVDAGSGQLFEEESLMDAFFNFEINPVKDDTFYIELDLTIKDDLDLPPSALALSDEEQWAIFDAFTSMSYNHTAHGRGNMHSIHVMIPWVSKIRWDKDKPDRMYVDVSLEMSASDQYQHQLNVAVARHQQAMASHDENLANKALETILMLENSMKNIILTLNWMKARMEATNFEVVRALEDDTVWKRLIKEVL